MIFARLSQFIHRSFSHLRLSMGVNIICFVVGMTNELAAEVLWNPCVGKLAVEAVTNCMERTSR